MNIEELYDISFQLILHSGDARSSVMEAMYEARSGQFDKAEQKLNEAKQELNKAHRFQTELIKKESGGDTYDIRIILVHAQDHLS